ncbi:MAG TPA: hypothetical protein VMG11_12840 [Steroidobacteraceae bacterium]|nr:hypothetical protein [Steroidobacteraceae bacterium]
MSAAIRILPQAPCLELTLPTGLHGAGPGLAFMLAMRPGAIQRLSPTGAILFIAPGRWLLTGDVLESQAQELSVLRECGACLVDISAKWCRFELAAARAPECLSRVIDVAQVLDGRDCAAVTILDCPALLARSGAGYELWVMRSFAQWLYERLIALPGWPAR